MPALAHSDGRLSVSSVKLVGSEAAESVAGATIRSLVAPRGYVFSCWRMYPEILVKAAEAPPVSIRSVEICQGRWFPVGHLMIAPSSHMTGLKHFPALIDGLEIGKLPLLKIKRPGLVRWRLGIEIVDHFARLVVSQGIADTTK